MEPQNNPEPQSLRSLQSRGPAETHLPTITPGFGSLQAYELMQRQAKLLAASTLVPEQYRMVIVKYDYKGNEKSRVENPNGLANCVLALNMALRMNADPIMVMQNLYLVEGKPSWSSQWVIAQINNCGRFEPLRFDMRVIGKKTVKYEYTEWENNEKRRKARDIEIEDIECTAWTVRKGVIIPHGVNSIAEALEAKLPILKGPKVSVEIAVKEGWYSKTGSKWQTMPELMLHYRSGAFFGRLYAPELLMGIPSQDELEDQRTPTILAAGDDGTYAPAESTVTELRRATSAPTPEPTIAPKAAAEASQASATPAADDKTDKPESTPAPAAEGAAAEARDQMGIAGMQGDDDMFSAN